LLAGGPFKPDFGLNGAAQLLPAFLRSFVCRLSNPNDLHTTTFIAAASISQTKEPIMNELVSQIAQRTGISEDKARQAAEVAINFFKSKLPGVGGQLDGVLHGGAAGSGAVSEKVQEGLGGVFGKKSA
jgi:hypothetical protein